MLHTVPLGSVEDPGDKGRGIRELALAGLETPKTLVSHESISGGQEDCVTGTDAIYDYLGLQPNASVIIRPSLMISRADAPGISGLYASREADQASVEAVVGEMAGTRSKADRDAELVLLGGQRASTGMCLLLQPLVRPLWSGVAHVRDERSGTRVSCGVVSGHLSSLVDGHSRGWQCELSEVTMREDRDVALVANEGDLMSIVELPGARAAMADLYGALRLLQSRCGEAREVEWAFDGGRLVFLQSQPIADQERLR
jgi:hypothetical protein